MILKNEVIELKARKIGLCTVAWVLTLAIVFPAAVSAHGVWFASRLDQVQLVLGEGFKDNAYDPKMVTSLQGYDAKYNKIPVKAIGEGNHITVINGGNHIAIEPTKQTAVVTVAFDYGYWSNDTQGNWLNLPMDQVQGSTVGTHAIKYSVNYLGAVNEIKTFSDIPYQIVPLVDPTKLNVGDSLTVQVLHEGKPMADVDIIPDVINHHTVTIKTDADGKAVVPVANGSINVIGMELTVPYEGKDQKATRSKVFSSFSFTIYPEETD